MQRPALYRLGIEAHWYCSDDRALHCARCSRPGPVSALRVCARHPGCESLKRKKPVHCACVGSLCELPSWTSSGPCVLGECAKVARSIFLHSLHSSLLSGFLWLWLEAAFAWDGVHGAALQVIVMIKSSSEAITLGGRKAKLADVRSNGEERFTLETRPPLYCRRLIPETRSSVPLHTTSSIQGGSTLQGVTPGLQETKRRRA